MRQLLHKLSSNPLLAWIWQLCDRYHASNKVIKALMANGDSYLNLNQWTLHPNINPQFTG